tara:strand:+ start:103 stop:597 length:495 start_codon:yes stop_codon:yes gene_type:complete
MKRNLILVLSVFLAMPILSKPITVFGFNWGMEPLKPAIEKEGYTCIDDILLIVGRKLYDLPPLEPPPQKCRKGEERDKVISLLPGDTVSFNCKIFNGCDSNLREVANNLSDYLGMQFRSNNNSGNFGFCARGSEGDLICVVDRDDEIKVVLEKSAYGKGRMTFD